MKRHFSFRFLRVALACLGPAVVSAGAASPADPAADPPTTRHFDFGAGPAAPGHIRVSPDAAYSKETGYGFDLGTKPSQLLFEEPGRRIHLFTFEGIAAHEFR